MAMGLRQTLEQELVLVTEFVALLAREQEVLVQGRTTELGQLTEAKTPILDRLLALATERDGILRKEGFAADKEGLKTWVTLQADDKLNATYDSLCNLSREARRLNQLNASLVSNRLQVTQQALSILLPGEQGPSLYDTQGQSSQQVGYKLIDSA